MSARRRTNVLRALEDGPKTTHLFQFPQTGDAAPTTVEARGTSSPARDSRRERNPSYDAARAAGAQMTGQRQDGLSQVPARTQYPPATHGGRGSIPRGICQCGCGERTNLSPVNNTARGYVRGEPFDYIAGHQCRKSAREYLEEDRGHTTPCWIWQRATDANGYGSGRASDGRRVKAHRLVYERFKGPIPSGLVLDHLCRQPSCVNPAHLEAVTNAENLRRGDGAKLTHAQVVEIRDSPMGCKRLARAYGVAPQTIMAIRNGRAWS